MRALFIGNSFTFRNDLPKVVKRLAEAGNPGLSFKYTKVTYGGRTLKDHWDLYQTQNILRLPELSDADLEKICAELENAGRGTKGGVYRRAAKNHRQWQKRLGKSAPGFDYVVLQSWRDTQDGLASAYAVYARKFAELAQQRGAKVILYNTAPSYQNFGPAEPPPDPERALAETRFVAALGRELDALVVPIPLAITMCRAARPELTFRYRNDFHPNQTCGYLTACAFYAVLFDRSPQGLPVDTVTDPHVVDKSKPDLGPDGAPRKLVLSEQQRALLQKTAWQAVKRNVLSTTGMREER